MSYVVGSSLLCIQQLIAMFYSCGLQYHRNYSLFLRFATFSIHGFMFASLHLLTFLPTFAVGQTNIFWTVSVTLSWFRCNFLHTQKQKRSRFDLQLADFFARKWPKCFIADATHCTHKSNIRKERKKNIFLCIAVHIVAQCGTLFMPHEGTWSECKRNLLQFLHGQFLKLMRLDGAFFSSHQF